MPSLECLCALCCSQLPKLMVVWVHGGLIFYLLRRALVSNLAMTKARIRDPVVSAVSF